MDGSSLDRRIILQRKDATKDSYGQQATTYTTYDTVWAEKLDIRGREYFAAQQTNAAMTTRFRVRFRTDILATDRIVYNAENFNIQQISEIGRKEGLEIFATAAVA